MPKKTQYLEKGKEKYAIQKNDYWEKKINEYKKVISTWAWNGKNSGIDYKGS